LKRPEIVLVVAAAENGIIGRAGELPWRIPEDLRHFKAVTMGKPILMGRKTFQSIGRPLPGRRNLVLSRDDTWSAGGVEVVRSLDDAITLASDSPELMVVGGEQVYRLAMPYADRIELTEVVGEFEGDTYFPIRHNRDWVRTYETPAYSPEQGLAINFVTLVSRAKLKGSYLNLELSDLLHKYGEGRHIPGSGSASALLGLIAARLLSTSINISYEHETNRDLIKRFRYIDHQLTVRHMPELSRLFDEDIEAFDEVMKLRVKRDQTIDSRVRKNIVSQERRRLQRATDIPFAISDHCIAVAEHSLTLFRHGYRAVRGDSGAAVSAACSGALAASFVIGVNVERFNKGAWHKDWTYRARDREMEAVSLLEQAINAVEELTRSSVPDDQPELPL
jgi:dihydrofolate reductase